MLGPQYVLTEYVGRNGERDPTSHQNNIKSRYEARRFCSFINKNGGRSLEQVADLCLISRWEQDLASCL